MLETLNIVSLQTIKDAPAAYVTLLRASPRGYPINRWQILKCPYCGKQHLHGAGTYDEDPDIYLGYREAHCAGPGVQRGGYLLTKANPFGCWVYDDALLVIRHDKNGYEIDLEKITSSASMLDWIFHVTDKLWCSPEDARDLLRILRKAFSPYDTLCGGSMNGSTGTLIADPANVIRKNVGLR